MKQADFPVGKMLKNFYSFKGWKKKKTSTKIIWIFKVPISSIILPLLFSYVVYIDIKYYFATKSLKNRFKEFIEKVVE